MTEKKFLLAVILISAAAVVFLTSATTSIGLIAFGLIVLGLLWGGISYALERISEVESLVHTQEEVLRQRMDGVEEYLDRKYGNPGEEDQCNLKGLTRRGKPARIDLAKVPLGPGGSSEEPKLGAISKPFVDRIMDEADQLRVREEMKSTEPISLIEDDEQ